MIDFAAMQVLQSLEDLVRYNDDCVFWHGLVVLNYLVEDGAARAVLHALVHEQAILELFEVRQDVLMA